MKKFNYSRDLRIKKKVFHLMSSVTFENEMNGRGIEANYYKCHSLKLKI